MDQVPPLPVPLLCVAMERLGPFMCSPMHVVQLPSWCYVGRNNGAPQRRHRWHYSNLPGWYVLLLTLTHVGLPVWTPPHVHDTCTHPHTAPLRQTLERP